MTDELTEISEVFSALEQWADWHRMHQGIENQEYIDAFGESILRDGLTEPLTNRKVVGREVERGANWREGLVFDGVNSRGRALLESLTQLVGARQRDSFRIYAPEAITKFAGRLSAVFPQFLGTEFAPTKEEQSLIHPIQHQDLTALTLPSEAFDFVCTSEVLEHVQDLDAALHHIARVLRPGGWHIATHPFAYNTQNTIQRAIVLNGRVTHLASPEYHGNPLKPADGSLVYQIPGWDILRRSLQAGFSYASMRYMVSKNHGYLSADTLGVFVLNCQK